ncbi:Stromal interaction molecule 1 [Holothuria leucospilota]|uniref:Stromal interaction molecule 1 n=1 Tax=Holothuria leucospilota TaxID=206669 RepID=A0A9Q1H0I2_HOLLE|nr:Stromal interaction molecule 1 [Holothuria leucospilota]
MGLSETLTTFLIFMTFHTQYVNVRGASYTQEVCWTALLVTTATAASDNDIAHQSTSVVLSEDFPVCEENDPSCSGSQEKGRPGFDAIKLIHRQIDDDHNGNVDLSESDEFLRDELKYNDDFERHNVFHHGDKQISVEELWTKWEFSTVYNWTVDETVQWLVECVELPEYAETFQNNAIEGSTLPKLAVNSPTFLQGILGITNPIHRQKISLKAMDAVLFGPPKPTNSYVKDWILVISLIVALGGCWFAFVQYRYSRNHIMSELESLQQAEDSLRQMQDKLDAAREDHESAIREKQSMEAELKDEINKAKREAERLRQVRKADVGGEDTMEHYAEKLRLAEEELVQVRSALQETERQLDELMGWSPPSLLQQWLQLTHEIEIRHHQTKKTAAERQLQEAKEICFKLRRKRGTLIGAFRMAHGSSMDEVDTKLERARSLLTDVTNELKERAHRWNQIEMLCNFPVVNNPGFTVLAGALGLQNIIEQARLNDSASIVGSASHLSEANPPMGIEECDDDIPPIPSRTAMITSPSMYTSLASVRSNLSDHTTRNRPMKTTQSLNNLLGSSQTGVPSTMPRAAVKPTASSTTPNFYLPDSSSEGYGRQDSDVSNSTTSSTILSSQDSESRVYSNQNSVGEKTTSNPPPKVVPARRLPSSMSDSSLLVLNGKDVVKKDGNVSPVSQDEEDTGSIGSGSDIEEKKKKKKFHLLGRKNHKTTKAS